MPQGKPLAVPDDGLTTRQRRRRALLVVHTGDMKGKSTAAFGLALRAWNQGWPLVVYQFVKSAKWKTGEEAALRALGLVHEQTGEGAPVTWHKMGEGWSWIQRPGTEADHAADAREGWEQVKRDLAAQAYRFYVLDEFTYPLRWGWISAADVVGALRSRPREKIARQRTTSSGLSARAISCASRHSTPLRRGHSPWTAARHAAGMPRRPYAAPASPARASRSPCAERCPSWGSRSTASRSAEGARSAGAPPRRRSWPAVRPGSSPSWPSRRWRPRPAAPGSRRCWRSTRDLPRGAGSGATSPARWLLIEPPR